MDFLGAKSVILAASLMFGSMTQPSSGIQSPFSDEHDLQTVKAYLTNIVSGHQAELQTLSSEKDYRSLQNSFFGYRTDDSWKNKDWYFTYGHNAKYELLIIAWAKDRSIVQPETISAQDLARNFLDDKLTNVKTEDQYRLWRLERAHVLSAFIKQSKGRMKVESWSFDSSGKIYGSASMVSVGQRPCIFRFYRPAHNEIVASSNNSNTITP